MNIFKNQCPRCKNGKIFSGIYSMNPKCPSCEFVFEKESGYFLGAIVVAYFVGAASLIPMIVATLFFLHLDVRLVVTLGIFQVLVLHPLLFRYSRMGWIHVENKMTSHLEQR